MSKKSIDLFEYIEGHTIRLEASHRGGGMLGAVDSSIQGHLREYPAAVQTKALVLSEALKRYYYNVTNEIVEDYDEWAASASFEAQQARPVSAY